jgi:hypothetical protein
MPFNINEFNGSLSSQGVAKQGHSRMRITVPQNLTDRQNVTQSLEFRIDSSEIPGRTLATTPYRDYGVIRNVPYDVNYAPLTIGILVSRDLREKLFFEEWQDLIIGDHRLEGSSDDFHRSKFNIGYYDTYVSHTIEIVQFDEGGEATYTARLVEAFPLAVNQMVTAWNSSDDHHLTVQLQYRYFQDKNLSPNNFPVRQRTGSFLRESGLGAAIGVGVGALAGRFRGLGPVLGGLAGAASVINNFGR